MKDKNYQLLFEKGVRAGEERDYSTAVKLFKHIIACTDKFPHALLYLGRSYHALGQYEQAVPVLEFYIKVIPDSGPGHFFLGRTYLTLGLYKKAINRLRFVARKNPAFTAAQSFLGIAFLKLHKPDTAVFYFEKALESDPENEQLFNGYLNSLLIKAIQLFNRGKKDEGEEIFKFIVENGSESILPHIYLGTIYREMGADDLSLKHFDIASSISPSDPIFPLLKALIFLHKGDSGSAYEELSRARELNLNLPPSEDPELLQRFGAITMFQNRRYHDAVRLARQILKIDYQDTDMHALMAESFLNLGEYEKSKNHFKRCIDVEKERLEFHHGLAVSMWELGEYKELLQEVKRMRLLDRTDEIASYFEALCMPKIGIEPQKAIPVLQSLIKKMGPDIQLMYTLGREYSRYGMPELAEGWFLRILKLNDNHRDSYLALIKSYQKMGRKKDLQKIYASYIARYPKDHNSKRAYIQLLIEIGDMAGASREIVSYLSHDPQNKNIKKMLAFCQFKTGKYIEAALIYRDLLRDEPESKVLLRSLVKSLYKAGNSETAIELLKRATEYLCDEPLILLPLGVLYSRNKDYEMAKKIFRRSIGVNPEDWRAYHNLAVLYAKTGQRSFAAKLKKTAERYRKKSNE